MECGSEFSIVTASLGQLSWLRLCVASVADQEQVTGEHLIQDGGADPRVALLAHAHPHVDCVQERDTGMYDALNRGLRRARGQILAWLNCDEQYLPRTLFNVRRFFEQRPDVDILFADAILVDLDGRALSYRRIVTPKKTHTRLDHLGTLSCATFFRRAIIDRGFLFDTRWRSIGDSVWVHALLEAGVRMASLNEPLSVYTFTGNNLSASARGYAEMREWSLQSDAPPRSLRFLSVIRHRLRKFAAGAYRHRSLQYAIYTLESPARRVAFDLDRVGFGWPGDTAPSAPGCEGQGRSNVDKQLRP